MSHRPTNAALPALAVLALLVLAFGLPRLVVLCTHSDGEASLEWAHLGPCCDHEHGAASDDQDDHDGHPAVEARSGCEHASLAIDTAPAPRDGANGELPAAHAAFVVHADFVLPARRPPTRLPPATGPPRPDPRTGLRATSQLLL
ncbi:MAG: hypothetical protein JNK78_12745 [Planctomycetes bacterium]|nr:hypothetical protein [Planctomycetota bacterium]